MENGKIKGLSPEKRKTNRWIGKKRITWLNFINKQKKEQKRKEEKLK